MSSALHALAERYASVRARTVALCAPLSVEDQQAQPMPDASPTKWHLAHTTWFFETFVVPGAEPPFDPAFAVLFNSYYQAVGPSWARAQRGLLTRPSLERVHAYRTAIDRRVGAALVEDRIDRDLLELGLHHEQQHQELILTDIKYLLGSQPLRPAYREDVALHDGAPQIHPPEGWRRLDAGLVRLGADPALGFAFDNERPAHDVLVRPFELSVRPIINAEVQAFIDDGGYRTPGLWLSAGWVTATAERWSAPLYWLDLEHNYTLGGVRPIDPAAVAGHLSYYEADAIARWLGARLPTEAEWELAARGLDPDAGNFADDELLHPGRPSGGQMFGAVWEWTSSSYSPYPGFRPLAGALGEYNGKFMIGQQVLRGGSCFTPRGHVRASYRNYFPPEARWQMSGARLAKDA